MFGNVGLAGHNRGYPVNYFENVKNLNLGDEIIYRYNDFETVYEVISNVIIQDTDWSYLEENDNNTITLITCVENEPSQRRCVQAVEKIE
jgi:LPXTG-site transpeptidase (sortase) family protein